MGYNHPEVHSINLVMPTHDVKIQEGMLYASMPRVVSTKRACIYIYGTAMLLLSRCA